jgi:hypothetical protein
LRDGQVKTHGVLFNGCFLFRQGNTAFALAGG